MLREELCAILVGAGAAAAMFDPVSEVATVKVLGGATIEEIPALSVGLSGASIGAIVAGAAAVVPMIVRCAANEAETDLGSLLPAGVSPAFSLR